MILLPVVYFHRSVKLFGKNQARQLMRKRHRRETEPQICTVGIQVSDHFGTADNKCKIRISGYGFFRDIFRQTF